MIIRLRKKHRQYYDIVNMRVWLTGLNDHCSKQRNVSSNLLLMCIQMHHIEKDGLNLFRFHSLGSNIQNTFTASHSHIILKLSLRQFSTLYICIRAAKFRFLSCFRYKLLFRSCLTQQPNMLQKRKIFRLSIGSGRHAPLGFFNNEHRPIRLKLLHSECDYSGKSRSINQVPRAE